MSTGFVQELQEIGGLLWPKDAPSFQQSGVSPPRRPAPRYENRPRAIRQTEARRGYPSKGFWLLRRGSVQLQIRHRRRPTTTLPVSILRSRAKRGPRNFQYEWKIIQQLQKAPGTIILRLPGRR